MKRATIIILVFALLDFLYTVVRGTAYGRLTPIVVFLYEMGIPYWTALDLNFMLSVPFAYFLLILLLIIAVVVQRSGPSKEHK